MLRPNLQAVIKLSGFCNARCRYCYEWDRLADKTRMSLDIVQQTASGFADLADLFAVEVGIRPTVSFILHGGEPLILPLDYLKEVVETFRSFCPVEYGIAVQTNAFSISDKMMDFIVKERISVSVSNDVIPGVRVSASGRPLEEQVHRNVLRLKEADVLSGGITVLNRVTAPHLLRIHEYWQEVGIRYRLLPLFRHGGPMVDIYGLTEEESATALADLAWSLLSTGQSVESEPLRETIAIAALAFAGMSLPTIGPLPFGRPVFVINTDGKVYEQTATDYAPQEALGDLNETNMLAIAQGHGIDTLLARDHRNEMRVCTSCAFKTFCSKWPLLVDARRSERCGVTYLTVKKLIGLLKEAAVAPSDMLYMITAINDFNSLIESRASTFLNKAS